MGAAREARTRFWAGFRAGSLAMFGYTAISLMVLRTHIGSGADSVSIFVVGLFVSTVYALIAGIIAGIAGAKLVGGISGGSNT